ncbi:unnamed protein product [Brassica oleracea]
MLLIFWFVIRYLNIDTSGRHVRKRSSDRVGEAANQHEKNIWLREATKLVLMCTYLMLAIHGVFQEAGFHERNASEEVSPVQFGDVDYKVHGLYFFCKKRH